MRSFYVFFDAPFRCSLLMPTFKLFKWSVTSLRSLVETFLRSAIWLTICARASPAATPEFAWCASNLYLRSFYLAVVPRRLDLTLGPFPAKDPVEPFLLPSNTVLFIYSYGVSAAPSYIVLNREFWVPLKRSLLRLSLGTDKRAQLSFYCCSNICMTDFYGLACLS